MPVGFESRSGMKPKFRFSNMDRLFLSWSMFNLVGVWYTKVKKEQKDRFSLSGYITIIYRP